MIPLYNSYKNEKSNTIIGYVQFWTYPEQGLDAIPVHSGTLLEEAFNRIEANKILAGGQNACPYNGDYDSKEGIYMNSTISYSTLTSSPKNKRLKKSPKQVLAVYVDTEEELKIIAKALKLPL